MRSTFVEGAQRPCGFVRQSAFLFNPKANFMLLELFRNHKRWLMFIAMVLVIPSLVVTGIYSYNRMISDDGAIAKVDDV